MPRALPWLQRSADAGRRKSASTGQAPKRRRLKAGAGSGGDRAEEDGLDENTTGVDPAPRPRRRAAHSVDRAPSTSPIPAPEAREPMREGWSADDAWMMVEDEFFSIAQSYTRHLHQAEYLRLKELAKANATSRPPPTSLLAGSGLSIGGRAGNRVKMKSPRPDPDLDADVPKQIGDPKLSGLMESPRKKQVVLRRDGFSQRGDKQHGIEGKQVAKRTSVKSPQRQAQPVPRQRQELASQDELETDDDDLDRPVKVVSGPVSAPAHPARQDKYSASPVRGKSTRYVADAASAVPQRRWARVKPNTERFG